MINAISDEKEAYISELIQTEIENRDDAALNFLLASKHGRWFLMRLLDNTNTLSASYTGQAKSTIYNEGKRAVGLTYIKKLSKLGLKGIKQKQQAEMEYAKFMIDASLLANKIAADRGGG